MPETGNYDVSNIEARLIIARADAKTAEDLAALSPDDMTISDGDQAGACSLVSPFSGQLVGGGSLTGTFPKKSGPARKSAAATTSSVANKAVKGCAFERMARAREGNPCNPYLPVNEIEGDDMEDNVASLEDL